MLSWMLICQSANAFIGVKSIWAFKKTPVINTLKCSKFIPVSGNVIPNKSQAWVQSNISYIPLQMQLMELSIHFQMKNFHWITLPASLPSLTEKNVCVCTRACTQVPVDAGKDHWITSIPSIWGDRKLWAAHSRSWESNSDPLLEQYKRLVTNLFLQPLLRLTNVLLRPEHPTFLVWTHLNN